MDVDGVLVDPGDVSEALDALCHVPLVLLVVIDIDGAVASSLVDLPADVEHKRAEENRPVLVPAQRWSRVVFLDRRSCPVPLSVVVSAQSPDLVECLAGDVSATEDDDHSVGLSVLANVCRVVDSRGGFGTGTDQSFPHKGVFQHVDAPGFVQHFAAGGAAEENDMRFAVGKGMAVSGQGLFAFHGDFRPEGLVLLDFEVVQVFLGDGTAHQCPAEHEDFVFVDSAG